ncbi:MAG: MATE family efflux transporter [Ruminococcus sp.]|jgi:putative MATE family efflux protein
MRKEIKTFFKYVIPSILSFALSGVYAIVDGYFVGNSIGDAGLSAINVAYPVVALLQAAGTGIGMGGAVYYSISKAERKEERAMEFMAGSLWLLILSSILLTAVTYILTTPVLQLLGMEGELLSLGEEYIRVIAFGAGLQIVGTGLVPFIRNHGGPFYAMISMIAGFITNIILDYLFVWVLAWGMTGAALATIIGQGITMLSALIFLLRHRLFTLRISFSRLGSAVKSIVKIGIAPFGLTMTPNISLIIINRFSIFYGGDKAVATYACIAYIICIVYLILQGVGDGSQPVISRYYGEKKIRQLKEIRKLAYGFGLFLAVVSCVIMFAARDYVGVLFGSSAEVNAEISRIIPIFLSSVPFVAICRVTTASFYATEESVFSYLLTFIEPVLMLILMLILPPMLGGQIMIWWSTVIARVLSAVLALILKNRVDRKKLNA